MSSGSDSDCEYEGYEGFCKHDIELTKDKGYCKDCDGYIVECDSCERRFDAEYGIGCCFDYKGRFLAEEDCSAPQAIDMLCPKCAGDENGSFESYDGRSTLECMDCGNNICENHTTVFEIEYVNQDYILDNGNGTCVFEEEEYVIAGEVYGGDLRIYKCLCVGCNDVREKAKARKKKLIDENGSIKNFKIGSLKNILIDFIELEEIDISKVSKTLLIKPNDKDKQILKAFLFSIDRVSKKRKINKK